MDTAPDRRGWVTSPEDRLRGAQGSHLITGLIIFFIFDMAIVLTLVLAMAPHMWWIIFVVTLAPVALIWLLVKLTWPPWERRFPARPQSPDAVIQSMQSFGLGRFMRWNNFLHIAADEECLHVIPPKMIRLFGAGPISVPWERFADVRPAMLGMMIGTLDDGTKIVAPGWALRLAEKPSV